MSDLQDDSKSGELLPAVRQLTEATQRIADSLAKLEALYAAELKKQEDLRRETAEDRAEFKERQKRWDAEYEETNKYLKKTRKDLSFIGLGTGWLTPVIPFLVVVAFAALAIAQVIQIGRR